jgi:hypothetical protein
MALMSATMKLTANPETVSKFHLLGADQFLPLLAMFEIGIALLILYPRTVGLGVITAFGYFSGALATEITHGQPMNALLMIILALVVGILRVPQVFLLRGKTA